jgi:hypothetical protein
VIASTMRNSPSTSYVPFQSVIRFFLASVINATKCDGDNGLQQTREKGSLSRELGEFDSINLRPANPFAMQCETRRKIEVSCGAFNLPESSKDDVERMMWIKREKVHWLLHNKSLLSMKWSIGTG